MKKEHLEVILEDIRGKFGLIIGGCQSLRDEMHQIRNDLAEKLVVIS